MSLSLLWLPIFLAHSTTLAPTPAARLAPTRSQEVERPRGAPQFSRAVARLANQGYQIRDLETEPRAESVDISLVLAKGRRAQKLSLRYDLDTSRFHSFRRAQVAPPTEDRSYAHGAELLEELSLSAPIALGFDCESFYLDFGSTSIDLNENAFEVELVRTEKAAPRALSSWLAEALAMGELLDVRDERYDDGAEVSAEVVFVLDTDEGMQELRARVGDEGEVLELSLHHTPGLEPWRELESSEALRGALAQERAIRSLNFVSDAEGEAPQLEIEFADKESFALPLDLFEERSEGCGC